MIHRPTPLAGGRLRAATAKLLVGVIIALASSSTFAAATTPAAAPRVALPGWRLELLLSAPTVKFPSVVAAAPDGRIFIGEDPMDIATPRADATEGRILCRHPDGRVTVFADKLYAPFGLQYLEGRLYVLHNPKFSVFEDAGDHGTNRVDLIEQTNPNASALEWNDHVPANFRLAMDGYFYMAVGDKGIYGAVGRDGKRVDLPGGGILRLRPDGTALEPFCLGVRNILDVAMDAEDELFTYDNTDEHEWMGRVTHMVEGGFYGYPHDFIPRRPYTLWCFADLGAGAATGAMALTEDGLPEAYRGNLVLADFSKRQLLRTRIARDGGTFQVITATNAPRTEAGATPRVATIADVEPFFDDPPEDFRPVGIAPDADGRSILVCDWQHRDSKDAAALCGRLWRLSWTGPEKPAPIPSWYVPAASGRPYTASTADLLAALEHPARRVRLCAQRRLAERARDGTTAGGAAEILGPLTARLSDTNQPPSTRLHALWSLDAIDEGRSARANILQAVRDASPAVQRHAIRQLGLRRIGDAVVALRPQLWNSDASVRREAATALGRLGDVNAALLLIAALDDSDLFARFAKFTALNRIGRRDPRVWGHLVRALETDRAELRQSASFAMRDTFDKALVERLAAAARDAHRPASAREAALGLLATLHRQPPPWHGEWGAYHPFRNPPPARTIPWASTETILTTLRDLAGAAEPGLRREAIEGLANASATNTAPELRRIFGAHPDAVTRRAVLQALGRFGDIDAVPFCSVALAEAAASRDLRSAALTTLGQLQSPGAATALQQYVDTAPGDAALLRQAIEALGQHRATTAIPALVRALEHPDAEVARTAVLALGRIPGEATLAPLLQALGHRDLTFRKAAVQSIGLNTNRAAIPQLLDAWKSPELKPEAFNALVKMPDLRALDAYLDALGSRNPEQRTAARRAIGAIRQDARPRIEARAASLPAAAVGELREIYRNDPEAANGPIFRTATRTYGPEEYLTAALQGPGDAERGRRLFADPAGVNCVACHRVAGNGGDVGPDLSNIGAQSDRRALTESVLYPSRVVRESYQRIVVEMKDGDEYAGLVKAETPDLLTLRDATGELVQLRKADVKDRRQTLDSLMPEGLHAALTLDEFKDLIAYLVSLRAKP